MFFTTDEATVHCLVASDVYKPLQVLNQWLMKIKVID